MPIDTPGTDLIVVSPHPDDAAFSLGGLLVSKQFASVSVVTVFSITNFLGIRGFQEEAIATEIRRAEDLAYCGVVEAKLISLGKPEAALRGPQTPEWIFGPVDETEFELSKDICQELDSIAITTRTPLILFPLGIGNHRDHVIARHAGDLLSSQQRLAVAYYEDLPYVARLSCEDKDPRWDTCLSMVSQIVCFSEPISLKLTNAQLYRTQVVESTLSDIARYARHLDLRYGAERLWSPKQSHLSMIVC